jgi:sterol 3beta-glucosyltransferase
MRILIVCNDTRGGVQPYAALARGLVAAGHSVSAVAPIGLTGLFDASVAVTPLAGTEEALAFASSGIAEQGTGAAMRLMARELPKRLGGWCQTVLEAAEGMTVMTGGIGGMAIGLAAAERLNMPFIASHLQPVGHVTSAYPGVLFPRTPGWTGAMGRRISHHLSDMAVWLPFRSAMGKVRRHVFGLSGRVPQRDGLPVIYGFSPHVVPMVDGPLRHVTGYWTLPARQGWQPPSALTAFLAGDKPVVSVGFGSMGAGAPLVLAALVADAARAAGIRVVMQANWQGQEPAPSDQLFAASDLPHDWLFPQMAANVHHGGAGTTGAALLAGRPSLVVPFAVDQPFWGMRVQELGVGSAPIARRMLDQAGLAQAFETMIADRAMQDKAATLGRALAREDGITAAVGVFDRFAERRYRLGAVGAHPTR